MKIHLLAFLLPICLTLSSCLMEDNKQTKIVVLLDLHGSQGSIGQEAMNGFLLGWQQMNEETGSRIFISLIDTQTSMAITEKAAKDTAAKVSLGAGFTDNNSILISGSYYEENKVPFLSIGATDPSLPRRFGNYIFLIPFGDNTQAAAAAEFAHKKFGKNAAVIWDSTSEYTKNLPQYFTTRFKQLEGEILYNSSYPGGCKIDQIANDLSQIDPKPDFIYLAGLPQCIENIILSLREYKIDLPVIGGDSLDTPNLTENDSLNNVWFTSHSWNGSDRSQQFLKEYQQTYNSLPLSSFAALGYDTSILLAKVFKQANSSNPDDLIKALESTKEFKGVTGTITYSDSSHVPRKTVWIIEVDQGKKSLADHFVPEKIPDPIGDTSK